MAALTNLYFKRPATTSPNSLWAAALAEQTIFGDFYSRTEARDQVTIPIIGSTYECEVYDLNNPPSASPAGYIFARTLSPDLLGGGKRYHPLYVGRTFQATDTRVNGSHHKYSAAVRLGADAIIVFWARTQFEAAQFERDVYWKFSPRLNDVAPPQEN